MHDIICPHCQKAFKVDEAGYADILQQVRNREFDQELHQRLEAIAAEAGGVPLRVSGVDEVEAALDDMNLHRFLDLVKAFKSSSQLVLITHQKRSMEIADILYGVTMHDDGMSRVISQRLGEQEQAAGVERRDRGLVQAAGGLRGIRHQSG